MSLGRDSLFIRQLKKIRRTEYSLKVALAKMEWEERVLYPEVEAAKRGDPVLGLSDGGHFEILVEDENHNQAEANIEAPQRQLNQRRADKNKRQKQTSTRAGLRHRK